VCKLCAASCPLAVLITVIEWNPAVFPGKYRRSWLKAEWERTIKAHHELWPRDGVIAMIVGEWDSRWVWLRCAPPRRKPEIQ
jgi:hypothetical protein